MLKQTSSTELPLYFRRVLENRVQDLAEELTVLKRSPVAESIHDTRVRSRRLRAALEAFPGLHIDGIRDGLYQTARRITRTLGRSREIEVNLALLNELKQHGDMADNICCEYLGERLQRRLEKRRRRMYGKLRGVTGRRLHYQCSLLVRSRLAPSPRAITQDTNSSSSGTPATQPSLFALLESPTEYASRILRELSEAFLTRSPGYRLRRAAETQLHALRIAAKKLRYTLEVFDDLWDEGLETTIAAARDFQNAGGVYHDWCVLSDFIRSELNRLTQDETNHLAFQIGRLLTHVEDRKTEMLKEIEPSFSRLRERLRILFELPAEPARGKRRGQPAPATGARE